MATVARKLVSTGNPTEGQIPLVRLPVSQPPCTSATDHARILLPLSSKPNASGLALTDDGFDEPVGCMPWSGFFPAGRIRDEFLGAALSPAASSEHWMRLLDLSAGLVLMRELMKSLERPVQESWDTRVSMWFPQFEDALRRSTNARPSFLPIPIAIAQSCKVDYLRLVEVKLQLGISATAPASAVAGAGAPGRTVCAITAVAELTNSLYHPNDGEPQALVAAFSAVIDLHSKGLHSHDCVVPIILNTGVLEQHAMAYLIGTAPCAVLTTPVVDLTDVAGQRVIAGARMAFVKIAQRTEELLLQLSHASLACPVDIAPSLDPVQYFWKRPLPLFGKLSVPHAVLHQLHVFNALSKSSAAEHVVEPVAVLMQTPPESAVKRARWRSGSAGAARAAMTRDSSSSTATCEAEEWLRETAMVFPRLHGFITGVPIPDHAHRAGVLAALRVALYRFHAAGVVHMDLFAANVMWRVLDRPGASAAAAIPEVCVRLVDLDASLFVGQPVPPNVARVIDRNGHLGSYHPLVFRAGQTAIPDFDWWHFSLLSDDSCPFSASGSAADLLAWLDAEGTRERVLQRVKQEVAGEERYISQLRGATEGSLALPTDVASESGEQSPLHAATKRARTGTTS